MRWTNAGVFLFGLKNGWNYFKPLLNRAKEGVSTLKELLHEGTGNGKLLPGTEGLPLGACSSSDTPYTVLPLLWHTGGLALEGKLSLLRSEPVGFLSTSEPMRKTWRSQLPFPGWVSWAPFTSVQCVCTHLACLLHLRSGLVVQETAQVCPWI